jgi:hypothetical protein
MKRTLALWFRRPAVRELLIFLSFLALTLVMTWPWLMHLRDAVTDPGDPYLNAWTMWWDYHQTFHDPLNLFHANIFYPYRYTLAFSEHDYGIALFFFPLFALGLRPLTIHGLAVLLGFAFCGYGTFRLARTVTGSTGAAWIAGITFAFIPYRFGQLPHVNYLFAGWIPILLEALVLFLRERSRKRAVWLGLAFFMNGLTCIHWFVLTLIPLGLSAIVLIFQYRAWRDLSLWRRGLVAIAIAGAGLIPFLIPYARAAELYGFVRNPAETLFYSAKPIDWLVGEYRNSIWKNLNAGVRMAERALFPGLMPLLLTLAAIFLVKPTRKVDPGVSAARIFKIILDLTAVVSGILIITISASGFLKVRVFGFYLLRLYSTTPVVITLVLALVIRLLIARPEVLKQAWQNGFSASPDSNRRSEAFWLGVIWTITGFLGSLGMNFYFHRFLYHYTSLFRSIRVPARWSMIAYLGLALLAGLGAKEFACLLARHWRRIRPATVCAAIAIALLVEQRAAPLTLIHGAVDPDALALWFQKTPMKGGIVELPTTIGKDENYLYTLRAADHGRPLVTAVSGFGPPLQIEIQSLTHQEVIPDRFVDLLESIPCSYLVVHNTSLEPANRLAIETVLARAITRNRVRFIRSYEGEDLYAVTKTEPNVKNEGQPPFPIPATASAVEVSNDLPKETSPNRIDDPRVFVRAQYLDFLEREPDSRGWDYWTKEIQSCGNASKCVAEQRVKISAAFFIEKEFQDTGFFVYRLYKATLGRAPSYQEFKADRAKLAGSPDLSAGKRAFTESWVKRSQFTRLYPSTLTAEQLVDMLLKSINETARVTLDDLKPRLIGEFKNGAGRARIVQNLAEDVTFSRNEYDEAFVSMQYFGYLHREPDPRGLRFWLDALARQGNQNNYYGMVRAFIDSAEYRARFVQQ